MIICRKQKDNKRCFVRSGSIIEHAEHLLKEHSVNPTSEVKTKEPRWKKITRFYRRKA